MRRSGSSDSSRPSPYGGRSGSWAADRPSARAGIDDLEDLPGLHGTSGPFERERFTRLRSNPILDQGVGAEAAQDRPGLRLGLEAGGDVHREPNRLVGSQQVAPEHANRAVPGVDPDPYPEIGGGPPLPGGLGRPPRTALPLAR